MTGVAGYKTTVKIGGTSTVFTAESFSLVSGNTWQIDDSSRRIWDRLAVFSFREGTEDLVATDILSIDYLFGTVTFTTPMSSIEGDGFYMPMTDIAGAHSYSLTHAGDILDDTDFAGAAADQMHSRIYGLRDVSLSVSRWETGDQQFFNAINNRTPLIIEVRPGDTNPVARGWFVPESEVRSGDVSSLEAADLSFQLDGDVNAQFSWGNP